MITIELQFPAGRYHATVWGRNVNEGEVEWPPSPFRLVRALVDAWKRRHPEWPEQRVEPILKALSGQPLFVLPPASAAHIRSYLSSNERDSTKKQLIYDAFVAIPRSETLTMGFEADLKESCLKDLEVLLGKLNFLGRSESWISARLADPKNEISWNCVPAVCNRLAGDSDLVQVACLRGPEDYSQLPQKPRREQGRSRNRDNPPPFSWIESISYSTRELLQEGWSSHPALEWEPYARRSHALGIRYKRSGHIRAERYCCAKFGLSSAVLPRIEETLLFAKRVRGHLMGIHKRIMDNPLAVSWRFSGKDANGRPLKGHHHAFFQPLDDDGDGYLDHLLVYCREPFSETELHALDRLRSTWQSNGRPDVHIVLTGLYEERPARVSKTWGSMTPFVLGRYYRKGRGFFLDWIKSEIHRECKIHDLPEPLSIELTLGSSHNGRTVRWFEFARKSGESGPVHSGYGCILRFQDELKGPFCIGALCHYGLGYFLPVTNNQPDHEKYSGVDER